MPGLGLAAGYGAAAGGDALKEMLKQKFLEQIKVAQLVQEKRQTDMQNQIQQQHLQQQGDFQNAEIGLRTRGADRADQEYADAAPMRTANLGHVNAETADLQGRPQMAADAQAAIAARAAEQQTFTGGENEKNRTNALRIASGHDANALRVARERPQALATVQTVDANGNPVTQFVQKKEGASYVKPANATTATRTASAETVNEVGNDLIKKLSDPKFAATVGPAMGRAGSLRDFIGNPPPEYSELAGQIESYSLANMGVHGMRSAQGAEMIKKLLDQRHTPESLAATIRGLNDFSTRFVEHNKPKAGGAAATPATAGAQEYDWVNGKLVPRK